MNSNARITFTAGGAENIQRETDKVRKMVVSLGNEINESINPFASEKDLQTFNTQAQKALKDISKTRNEAFKSLTVEDKRGVQSGNPNLSSKGVQNFTSASKEAADLSKNISAVNKQYRDTIRGRSAIDTGGGGVRELGYLEKNQLERERLASKMNEALTAKEAGRYATQIRGLERDASIATGLSDTSEGGGNQLGRGLSYAAMVGGSGLGNAIGGAIGEVTSAIISTASAGVGAPVAGAAALAGMLIPRGERVSKSRYALANLGAGNGVKEADANLTKLGVSIADTNEAMAEFAKITGQTTNLQSKTTNKLVAENVTGAGAGAFDALLSQSKYGVNANTAINEFVGTLKNAGINKARIPEMAQNAAAMNMVLLRQTGVTDVGKATQLVSGIDKIGTMFRGEEGMGRFEQINQAIKAPNNEYMQAVTMRSLMADNPNMTMYQLQKKMQQGATGENFGALMKSLEKMSGGDNEMFATNVAGAFTGGDLLAAEQLISGSKNSKTGDYSLLGGKKGSETFNVKNFSGITELQTQLENLLQTKGEGSTDRLKTIIEDIKALIGVDSEKPSKIGNSIQKSLSGNATIDEQVAAEKAGVTPSMIEKYQKNIEIGRDLGASLIRGEVGISQDSINALADAIKSKEIAKQSENIVK